VESRALLHIRQVIPCSPWLRCSRTPNLHPEGMAEISQGQAKRSPWNPTPNKDTPEGTPDGIRDQQVRPATLVAKGAAVLVRMRLLVTKPNGHNFRQTRIGGCQCIRRRMTRDSKLPGLPASSNGRATLPQEFHCYLRQGINNGFSYSTRTTPASTNIGR
jgi:hypothetical protein